MGLLVSLKNHADRPGILPQAFRQIEVWANRLMWQPAVFGTGWSSLSVSTPVSVVTDPFGFVHVRGRATLSGTIANGGSSNILTVLVGQVPVVDEVFGQNVTAAAVLQISQRTRTLFVYNGTGGVLTNPTVNLGGIFWSTH
jgi:hypothetical protein